MYSQFGSAVKRVFSTENNDFENNNILETTHHSKPIFEKINPEKYFRITVSETRIESQCSVLCYAKIVAVIHAVP